MGKTKQDRMATLQRYSAIAMLLLLIAFNSVFTSNFFAYGTLNNIITQICPTVLCGMGMTLVISTGGIDISVGSVMALAGVITARYMTNLGIIPSLILAVIAAAAVGCINGFCVGKLKLQAMVITLGMQLAIRGLAQVLCNGRDIYFNKLGDTGTSLSLWGSYKIGGIIPVQIIPIVISVVIVWMLAEKTVFGRQVQAVGDNILSSTLAGINAARTLMLVYGICAVSAAFAGVFQAARVTVAAGSSLGQLAELDAIAAVVIGGTPMSGGRAHVFGTIIGALIMQVITLTCVMNNIPDEYAQVLKAVIIVFAVFIQREQSK
ncbi:MAG: ABC transporter permease [Clostridiales bacterium]|nr:ABC transporter permease [Clostridiales bacterium]